MSKVDLMVLWWYVEGGMLIRKQAVFEVDASPEINILLSGGSHPEIDFTSDLLFFPHPDAHELWSHGWEDACSALRAQPDCRFKFRKVLERLGLAHLNAMKSLIGSGCLHFYKRDCGRWVEHKYSEEDLAHALRRREETVDER